MAGLLGDIFSAGNVAKRKLTDLLGNPILSAQQMLGNLNDRARVLNEMTAAAAREGVSYGPSSQQLAGLLSEAYNPMGLTVFHGSPAKFQKFDPTKIGSGEGAQSYGYGHYVAESPKTAESYRSSVTKFNVEDGPIKGIATLIAAKGKEGENLARKTYKELGDQLEPTIKKAKDIVEQQSSLYKVDLPDEQIAKMLDWDKPLNKQVPEVKDALKKLGYQIDDKKLSEFDDALLSALSSDIPVDLPKQPLNLTGEAIYRQLGNPQQASQKLRDIGIPGIRYLDEGSRSNFKVQNTYKGQPYGEPVSFMTEKQAQDYAAEQIQKGFGAEILPGTSNFVVFPGNEDLLRILERNNQPLSLLD